MLTAGFLSGFMGTSSAIGGPPMALVMQHEGSDFIRANLAAFFIVSCVLSLAMLVSIDRFGAAELAVFPTATTGDARGLLASAQNDAPHLSPAPALF